MQSKVRHKANYIGDGEQYFRKWTEWGKAGTIQRLADWAGRDLGLRNPRTGKPPTGMGVWQKMWRWALRNPDLSRPLYEEYVLELDGEQLMDEEWNSLIHSRAKLLLTHAGYRKYLKKYPFLEKYAS